MLYTFFNFLSVTGKGTIQVTVLVFLDLQRLEIIREGASLHILRCTDTFQFFYFSVENFDFLLVP